MGGTTVSQRLDKACLSFSFPPRRLPRYQQCNLQNGKAFVARFHVGTATVVQATPRVEEILKHLPHSI